MPKIEKYEGYENYYNLAASIILQAIKDYERGLKYQKRYTSLYTHSNKFVSLSTKDKNSAEAFFYSPWFVELSRKMDGATLKHKLDNNFKKYGKCILNEEDLKDLILNPLSKELIE